MYQHNQLIERAKKLGVKVTDVSSLMQKDSAILDYQGQSELVNEGVPTSWINVRSQYYCDNKQLTKLAYETLNIPYPKSIPFKDAQLEGLEAFFTKGRKYVCKPLDATNGIGVILDICSLEEVKAYFEAHKHLGSLFMLEEQIEGADLRIHVLGGKIVAACIREPAFVMGNGRDSLQELIEKRREVMRTQNPQNFLEIDEATKSLLLQQKLTLTDIPVDKQKVQLKYVSNMAQGGIATDVTDSIHPTYHDWVHSLTSYLQTSYFGLDIITSDFTKNPNKNAWVLEINARADWMHHTFSEVRTHDMAGLILKELFIFC